MDKQKSLSKISKELMLKEPYYGFFLIMLNKVWRKDLPTAGVSKNGINFQLAINEDFWTSYRDWETDRKSTRLNSSHRL